LRTLRRIRSSTHSAQQTEAGLLWYNLEMERYYFNRDTASEGGDTRAH